MYKTHGFFYRGIGGSIYPALRFDFSAADRLWQQPAATDPVTAVGQTIGLATSLYGSYEAEQATLTARPLYAVCPEGGVRNLFQIPTEDLTNAGWGKIRIASISNTITESGVTLNEAVENTETNSHYITRTITVPAGATINISGCFKVASGTRYVRLSASSDSFTNLFMCLFDPATGVVALAPATFGTAIAGSATVEDTGNGVYRFALSGRCGASATSVVFQAFMQTTAGSYSGIYEGDGTSGLYMGALQWSIGATLYDYQKVGAGPYDISEVGITPAYCALYDGGDDVLPNDLTLPAISGGQIVIASPAGIYIDDFDFAGGSWDFGPTTYTGGDAGVLALCQNRVIGVSIYAATMTTEQEAAELAYWHARGAAEVLL